MKKSASKRVTAKKSVKPTARPLKSAVRKSTKVHVPKYRRTASKDLTIQHVLPLGNGWVVKTSTAQRFLLITDTKREAVQLARQLARSTNTELVVYGRNGQIQVRESYIVKR